MRFLKNGFAERSNIPDYDIVEEGDLFEAPDSIPEEPISTVDPLSAALRMISCGEVSSQGLCDLPDLDLGSLQSGQQLLDKAFYECEKDLMMKSAMMESPLSEVLDIKNISVVTTGINENQDMQKSLDFGSDYGMRRAFSEGDIQRKLGTVHFQSPLDRIIVNCTSEDRREKLSRYRNEKSRRNFGHKIKVKLIQSWKQTPPYADETLEMVLADETGEKIHASCPRSQMFRTQRTVKFGEWGVIENFKVSAVGKGKFRPTTDYKKISNGSQDVNILIDILGQPYDISPVQLIQVKDEDRKRIQFRMRDMRFAKIGNFRGEIQITNPFDTSLLDMNPTVAEAVDFRKRLEHDPLPLALANKKDEKREIINVADDWDDIGITKISELLEITEENMRPDSRLGQMANRINIVMNTDQNQDVSTAAVPLRSIFSRVIHEIDSSPSSIPSPVNQSINTPDNTTPKTVCLFGVDLMSKTTSQSPLNRSCLTSLPSSMNPISNQSSFQNKHSKRSRILPRSALNDITNISTSLATPDDGTRFDPSYNAPEEEIAFEDGTYDGDGDLDFDCSSQEST
ncbi:hypothetical protein Bca4012_024962 [Brassica carinata]